MSDCTCGMGYATNDGHDVDCPCSIESRLDNAFVEIERLQAELEVTKRRMKEWKDYATPTFVYARCKTLEADNARLREALEYIAEYAHPDFPTGDLESELDRAEKLWLHFQDIAQFALKRKS